MQLALHSDLSAPIPGVARRRWAAAGVALVGASLIAATPAVTPLPAELERDVSAAVRLTAGWDPAAAWINAINTSSVNASTLFNNFALAPFVGLQQAIVNQAGYVDQLLNDPSSISNVADQIRQNIEAVTSGSVLINASAATMSAVTNHTLDGLHNLLLGNIASSLPPNVDPATVTAVMNFLSSPVSGMLIGAVGPVLSPGVALFNSAMAIANAVQNNDIQTAIQDLVDIPANMVNAFYNGATLDLTALTPYINQSGVLGDTTFDHLDIAFGGLFSVGSVGQGSYNPGGGQAAITTPGGSILNSIGLVVNTTFNGVPITGLQIPSHAIGPIAAAESMSQTIGVLLGDNWDGKNGAPVPPLSHLKFPTIHTVSDVDDVEPDAAAATTPTASKLATASEVPAVTTTKAAVTSAAPEVKVESKAADTLTDADAPTPVKAGDPAAAGSGQKAGSASGTSGSKSGSHPSSSHAKGSGHSGRGH